MPGRIRLRFEALETRTSLTSIAGVDADRTWLEAEVEPCGAGSASLLLYVASFQPIATERALPSQEFANGVDHWLETQSPEVDE